MKKYSLNENEAYQAMCIFLDHLYNITKDDGLGAILGSMQLLKDGKPIDNAYWTDWINAINRVVVKS